MPPPVLHPRDPLHGITLERMLTECNGDVALLCQRMGVDPKAIPAITQMAQSMVEKKAQEVTRGARK